MKRTEVWATEQPRVLLQYFDSEWCIWTEEVLWTELLPRALTEQTVCSSDSQGGVAASCGVYEPTSLSRGDLSLYAGGSDVDLC